MTFDSPKLSLPDKLYVWKLVTAYTDNIIVCSRWACGLFSLNNLCCAHHVITIKLAATVHFLWQKQIVLVCHFKVFSCTGYQLQSHVNIL